MSAEEKLRRLRELMRRYYELQEEIRKEMRADVDLGSFPSLGEEAAEKLRLLHYDYDAEKGRLTLKTSVGEVTLGPAMMIHLLYDVLELARRGEAYELMVESLRLVDEELYKRAKEAFERLRLAADLMARAFGGSAEEAARFMLNC